MLQGISTVLCIYQGFMFSMFEEYYQNRCTKWFLRYIYPAIAIISTVLTSVWQIENIEALKIPSLIFLCLTVMYSVGISIKWFIFLVRITRQHLYPRGLHPVTRLGYSLFLLYLGARLAYSNVLAPLWPPALHFAGDPVLRMVLDAMSAGFAASQVYVTWSKQEEMPKNRYYSYGGKREEYKLDTIPENLII